MSGTEDGRAVRLSQARDVVHLPREVFEGLVKVAVHVSYGKSAAFSQDRPYPDATARFALGALDEAGLLPGVEELR